MIEETDRRIVGAFTWPYEFWTRDGKHMIAHGFFENDDEAEAWIKEHYPVSYSQGVDMRRFD